MNDEKKGSGEKNDDSVELTIKELEEILSKEDVGSVSLEYLFSFGQVLMDELHARMSLVDGKANSLLGWSAAFVAFLLVGPGLPVDRSGWDGFFFLLAALYGVAAAISSAIALRLRAWNWPSTHDWFQVQYLTSPESLICGHVLSLYEVHRDAGKTLDRKADCVGAAQYLMLIAIGCVLVVIVLGLAAI